MRRGDPQRLVPNEHFRAAGSSLKPKLVGERGVPNLSFVTQSETQMMRVPDSNKTENLQSICVPHPQVSSSVRPRRHAHPAKQDSDAFDEELHKGLY